MTVMALLLLATFQATSTVSAQEQEQEQKRGKKVLIIGGGSIGICSAYFLKQKGMDVTVMDKGELVKGCSYGNAGLVVPSSGFPLAAPGLLSKGFKDFFSKKKKPFSISPRVDKGLLRWIWHYLKSANERHLKKAMPLLLEMGRESAKLHQGLEDQCGIGTLNRKGRMEVFLTPETFKEAQKKADALRKQGVESQVLDKDEVQSIERNLLPSVVGAVYYPNDANLIPYDFLRNLAAITEKEGVQMVPHSEVTDFEFKNGRIVGVKTSKGVFRPDLIVLAAGAETPLLTKKLGMNVLVESGEGYSITMDRPENAPQIPLILGEHHVAVSPMGDKLRVAGYMGLRGLKSSYDKSIPPKILGSIKEYLDIDPNKVKIQEEWRGRRPCSPDGLPIIGKHPKYSNLIVATGHGTLGMHLGPITGKLVSEIANDEAPSLDISSLRCDRF